MVSVIIPIYNTAEYLNQCVASVLAQTYSDLEVFLIDDCSTDGSKDLIDEWARKDKRVQAIHMNENSGVSESRNIGLKSSKGDYVAFVDSDDWLEPTFVEALVKLITEADADIAICGYFEENNEEVIKRLPRYETGALLDSAGVLQHCIPRLGQSRVDLFIWDKLYRRSALTKSDSLILFDKHFRYCEDVLWLVEVTLNCKRGVIWQEAGYHYRIYRAGNTRTEMQKLSNLKYALDAQKVNQAVYHQIQESEICSNNAYQRIIFSQYNLLRTAKNVGDTRIFNEYKKGYLKRIVAWWLKDKSMYGFKWACKRLASYFVWRIRHL